MNDDLLFALKDDALTMRKLAIRLRTARDKAEIARLVGEALVQRANELDEIVAKQAHAE